MNRQELEYHARRYGLAVVLVLALIVFLMPLILRLSDGSPIVPGPQSYTHLRHSALLQEGKIYDPLRGVTFAPNPYGALLAFMGVFGVPWLLPVLLAMLFITLLYHYLERVIPVRGVVVLALIAIVLSPTMSVLATQLRATMLALNLLLAAIILDKRPVVSSILVGLAIITSPVLGTLVALFLALQYLVRKEYHEAIGIALSLLVAIVWFVLWTGQLPLQELTSPSFDTNVLFELGNNGGLTVFFILIAMYSLVLRFTKHRMLALSTIMVTLATVFFPSLLPLAAVLLSIFVGITVFLLITTKWELELLKESLLMLIGCISIFLLITTARERADDAPDADFAHKMTILRNQHREGNVLTHPTYMPMVEQFSGRRAPILPQEVFYSRNAQEIYAMLNEAGISYILITEEMEQTMFKRSDEGILFLLQNSERFVIIEETEGGTLWYYIKT
jgi:hypothetical protein